jgi:hypothetical protein
VAVEERAKWEYKTWREDQRNPGQTFPDSVLQNASRLEDALSILGEEGWELVGWHSGPLHPIFVFKRPR